MKKISPTFKAKGQIISRVVMEESNKNGLTISLTAVPLGRSKYDPFSYHVEVKGGKNPYVSKHYDYLESWIHFQFFMGNSRKMLQAGM